MRIAFLWATGDPGLYSNASFDTLYKNIGHNNGNLAFVAGLKHSLDGNIGYYAWHTPAEVLNREADVVVIPCANQLGGHTDLGALANTMGKLDIPIVAVGLGAQAKSFDMDVELTPGTERWLNVLLENGARYGVANIYTRGPYTTRQIKKLTGADVTTGGCPSQFINLDPSLGRNIAARWNAHPLPRSVVVAGGHQSWGQVRMIEQQLIAMMMDPIYPGSYVVQSMGDMIKTSRELVQDIAPDKRAQIHKHTVPHYSEEMFETWCNRFSRSFYDVPAWMDELRRHDLVIGPRYHGTALAVQTGRMGVTVTFDSRTEELCGQTGVPFLRAADLVEPLTRTSLKSLIKFDGAKYDSERRYRAGHYMAFLHENGLKPRAELVGLAQQDTETELVAPPAIEEPVRAVG